MHRHTLTIFLLLSSLIISSQSPLINNVYNRASISLNGEWRYIIDPYENGYYNYRYEPFDKQQHPWASAFFLNSKPKDKSDLLEYDFDKMDVINVPGDWNTQKEKLFYYEGTVWYKKSFDYNKTKDEKRQFLYIGAINYTAEVYLNGAKLGTHTGGFTPFNFEISKHLKTKDNFIIIKVDNKRVAHGVPTLNTDWWNYGGITRDIKIVETPNTFVLDYNITLDKSSKNKIVGYVQLNESIGGQNITLNISELGISQSMVTDETGKATIDIATSNITYWTPDNPKLYKVDITSGGDNISDHIGLRTISTSGHKILLNNKPVFLKGICMHEESPTNPGRANTETDAIQLLSWAKELGCNYIRLAHYPHNEHMVRQADKMGLLIWEEIPVYWTIDWDNPDTYSNAENQLKSAIARDKNRASVIIWSMANETPHHNDRHKFLNKLIDFTRSQDDSRLISAALEQSDYNGDPNIRTINDPIANKLDILSFNQYIGWYDGLPEKCQTIQWQITQNKPVMISEFGAGAKHGQRGDKLTRWTEDYQAYLYTETIKMLSKIDKLSGFSPWILVDFRSPRRVLPEIQDGWNRKGLISDDGKKKEAFYILQSYYQGIK